VKRHSGTFRLVAIYLALTVAALACSLGGSDHQATVEALERSLSLTATAGSGSEVDFGAEIQAAQAQATTVGESLAATQAAQEAISAEAKAATASAFEPYLAELPKYGVDPGAGRPGWLHPPLQLVAEGHLQYDYGNQFLATVAQDFVVSADITWNTRFGTSGCGFVLRSDGDKEALSQYLVVATRAATGHVLFSTMAKGQVIDIKDIYAYGIDPEFDWRNDGTNRLTVVARGETFSIFTNGTLIGELQAGGPPSPPGIPPPPEQPGDVTDAQAMLVYNEALVEYNQVVAQIQANYRSRQNAYQEHGTKFGRGFIAMVALNESGRTTCQYDNAWLWLIDS
jgi:hypothetical protein